MLTLILTLYALQTQCQPITCEEKSYTTTVEVSAYNACEWQTDSTPRITASGMWLEDDSKVAASNFLPIGTIISVAGTVYTVEDTMAKKYDKTIDLFFGLCTTANIEKAIKWGRRNIKVKIYE